MPHPKMPDQDQGKTQDYLNIVFTLTSAYCACLWPFIRCRFGHRAFAGYPLSLILMLVYSGHRNCPLMIQYVAVWLIIVAYRRLTTDSNAHSMSQGVSWLGIPPLLECLVPLGVAAVFSHIGEEAMSDFFMGMIPAMVVVAFIERAAIRARDRAVKDAGIQARRFR